MKCVLQSLYDGELYPAEQILPKCAEYKEVNRKISDEKHHFYDILSETERNRFDELFNLRYQADSIESYESFACGFRLGACLMIEALIDNR